MYPIFRELLLLVLLCNFSCTKEPVNGGGEVILPLIKVSDASVQRTKDNALLTFFIQLDKASSSPVSFDYKLYEDTALPGRDYVEKAGSLTIPAGQFNISLPIEIIGDEYRQSNLNFSVELVNVKGATILLSQATGTIITENGTKFKVTDTGFKSAESYPGLNLVWEEGFSQVNSANWNFESGNGAGGWGNNELQSYTSSTKNIFTDNGYLIIEARKEDQDGFKYTSARMTTKGKKEFAFGRMDIRAKLPKGVGIWPAIWMLGANISEIGWPRCGEIDIMELIGSEPQKVHGTAHWQGAQGHRYEGASKVISSGDYSNEFHVYSINWKENSIQWLVDDVPFYEITATYTGEEYYPFNKPQFFILNVAVGGNWPGPPSDATVFPQRMIVDYIRVFQ